MDIDRRTFISGTAAFTASVILGRIGFSTPVDPNDDHRSELEDFVAVAPRFSFVYPAHDERMFAMGYLKDSFWRNSAGMPLLANPLPRRTLSGEGGLMEHYALHTTPKDRLGDGMPERWQWWWQRDGFEKLGICVFNWMPRENDDAGRTVVAKLIYVDGKPVEGYESLYPWSEIERAGAESVEKLIREGLMYPRRGYPAPAPDGNLR